MKTQRLALLVSVLLLLTTSPLIPSGAIPGLPQTGTLSWKHVVIPDLPPGPGTQAPYLWTDRPGSLYVWTQHILPGTTDVPEAILFRWNRGIWHEELRLPGYSGTAVFGTGPEDIYAAASGCPRTTQEACAPSAFAEIYRFGGTTWSQESLPSAPSYVLSLSGFPDEVQAGVVFPYPDDPRVSAILRRHDNTWSEIFTTWPYQVGVQWVTLLSPTEGYFTGCIGFGRWNGVQWTSSGYGFCDVYDIWGTIGASGETRLYTAGNQGFSNGMRVWQYDQSGPTFSLVFSDPTGGDPDDGGSAFGIWGSAPDDVYVVGRHGLWSDPTSGRIYHFDGTDWTRLFLDLGDIPVVRDVWGSGSKDIWFSLNDGTLIHAFVYDFSGFFAPVENPPAFNAAKAGRAVPIKFSLGGDQGLDVLAPGYPLSRGVACGDLSSLSDPIPTVAAGNSSLSYDPIAGHYTYVWKTETAWAGTCREFVLRLDDGTEKNAYFAFR